METNTETISYLKLHLNFNEHDCATRTGYFMCVHLTILNINVFHIYTVKHAYYKHKYCKLMNIMKQFYWALGLNHHQVYLCVAITGKVFYLLSEGSSTLDKKSDSFCRMNSRTGSCENMKLCCKKR